MTFLKNLRYSVVSRQRSIESFQTIKKKMLGFQFCISLRVSIRENNLVQAIAENSADPMSNKTQMYSFLWHDFSNNGGSHIQAVKFQFCKHRSQIIKYKENVV